MVNQRRQSRWVESATTGSTRLHRFVAPPTAEPLGWINKSEVAESIQPTPVLQVKSGPTSQLSPAVLISKVFAGTPSSKDDQGRFCVAGVSRGLTPWPPGRLGSVSGRVYVLLQTYMCLCGLYTCLGFAVALLSWLCICVGFRPPHRLL